MTYTPNPKQPTNAEHVAHYRMRLTELRIAERFLGTSVQFNTLLEKCREEIAYSKRALALHMAEDIIERENL